MAASLQDISYWFDKGVKNKRRYMVVFCDEYDFEDYPSYFDDAQSAIEKMKSPGAMQRPMECYDLQDDKDRQMAQYRCWALSPR